VKSARVWTETVSFVECPECGEVDELGTDVSFEDGAEHTCEECKTVFTLTKGED
jgi:predicted RNA-binding Zn-ribbon protein involved in translation (DUF1610 family)